MGKTTALCLWLPSLVQSMERGHIPGSASAELRRHKRRAGRSLLCLPGLRECARLAPAAANGNGCLWHPPLAPPDRREARLWMQGSAHSHNQREELLFTPGSQEPGAGHTLRAKPSAGPQTNVLFARANRHKMCPPTCLACTRGPRGDTSTHTWVAGAP